MEAEHYIYKKEVSKKEREECYQWFEQRMDRLPKTLRLETMYIKDLPYCVRRTILSLRVHFDKAAVFSGQYTFLQRVREALCQQEGFEA